jgi:hypothetical protein
MGQSEIRRLIEQYKRIHKESGSGPLVTIDASFIDLVERILNDQAGAIDGLRNGNYLLRQQVEDIQNDTMDRLREVLFG